MSKKYRGSNPYLLSAECPASKAELANFAIIVSVLLVMMILTGI